ncbi:VOC family protein [Microlunatus sp. Gsoil 973]|uniref:VOC family protein n=1 Tax=Microlunatus sp. Gsoil 973 TaxID=2672569 RepID=UPI0012B4BC87|nr:VOC family protein [Microlunatus sp. Gsoil 973]QGN33130.1 glyoxalase [Microlunatus sp. Gsoil 973]
MNDRASIHHVELWLPDLDAHLPSWDWLFGELGWEPYQRWEGGRSWRAGDGSYVVIEESPDLDSGAYSRLHPGINHLAVTAARELIDHIVAAAPAHGWTVLFADRHPYAGGRDHYAAYLENDHGFEVEIVAS